MNYPVLYSNSIPILESGWNPVRIRLEYEPTLLWLMGKGSLDELSRTVLQFNSNFGIWLESSSHPTGIWTNPTLNDGERISGWTIPYCTPIQFQFWNLVGIQFASDWNLNQPYFEWWGKDLWMNYPVLYSNLIPTFESGWNQVRIPLESEPTLLAMMNYPVLYSNSIPTLESGWNQIRIRVESVVWMMGKRSLDELSRTVLQFDSNFGIPFASEELQSGWTIPYCTPIRFQLWNLVAIQFGSEWNL